MYILFFLYINYIILRRPYNIPTLAREHATAIINRNNQTPKEAFEATIGFTTAATSIVDIGLE